jgi:hypothetical protein
MDRYRWGDFVNAAVNILFQRNILSIQMSPTEISCDEIDYLIQSNVRVYGCKPRHWDCCSVSGVSSCFSFVPSSRIISTQVWCMCLNFCSEVNQLHGETGRLPLPSTIIQKSCNLTSSCGQYTSRCRGVSAQWCHLYALVSFMLFCLLLSVSLMFDYFKCSGMSGTMEATLL